MAQPSTRRKAEVPFQGRPHDQQQPARRLRLDLLDLGPPIDPGRAWCLARSASSQSAETQLPNCALPVEHVLGGEGDSPLVRLLRQKLAPRPSDHPSSSAADSSTVSPPLPYRSTSYQAPGGPREKLTWSGNAAVWTKGVEVARSFVFEPDELIQAAVFASLENEPTCPSSSSHRPGESVLDVTSMSAATVVDEAEVAQRPASRLKARQSQARGPRISEGASFVRQSAHPPAHASLNPNASAILPSAGPSSAGRPGVESQPSVGSTARRRRKRARALCFLFANSLLVHLASGARHVLSLPCEMEPKLWAIEGGGVALRSLAPLESALGDVAHEQGILYVVRHALDGVIPLSANMEQSVVLVDPTHLGRVPARNALPVDLIVRCASAVAASALGPSILLPADGSSLSPGRDLNLGDVFETSLQSSAGAATVKLPDLARAGPLVQRCLQALDGVLSDEALSSLRLECIQQAGQHRSTDSAVDTQFRAFESALLAQLGLGQQVQPSQSTSTSSASPTAWERISRLNASSEDPAFGALSPQVPTHLATPSLRQAAASGLVDQPRAASVLLALHLLAEDFRLDILQFQHLRSLGALVMRIGLALGRRDWVDYWFRQGCPMPHHDIASQLSTNVSLPSPPDIYAHLRAVLAGRSAFIDPWPQVPTSKATKQPSLALTIAALYSTLSIVSPASAADSSEKVVGLMIAHGLTKDHLLRIPFGIALPLMAAVKTCQMAPSASWSPAFLKLIRRPDLAARPGTDRPLKSQMAPSPQSIRVLSGPPTKRKEGEASASTFSSLSLRFGSDRRLEEVDRLLSTARVSTFKLRDEAGLSEQEIATQHQAHAGMITSRTLSVPAGQGMFNFASCLASTTNVFVIPAINTTVKTSWDGGVHVVQAPALEPERTQWPDFANGVAQALRIRSDSQGIDSSWIVYNKPQELNPSHGGFLLGLGLAGHLRKMMPWHAFPYFDARHEPTSVGLLLGFAASHLSTADPLLTKIMSLHVHALLPHGSRELHSTPLVQAASLMGIGMLYLASGNRRMADVALSEIPRENSSEEAPVDSQAYAFSAAISFGMVMLGRGGEATRSGDPLLVARLRTLISGSASGSSSDSCGGGTRSSRDVKPDLNVTSGPATLALGLMYLRTERDEIAAMLEIPQSIEDLQAVRPDLLFSRTLTRNLILWSQITDTEAWIDSNVPSFIRSPLGKRSRDGASAGSRQAMDLARYNILAGACFALALKYAGTARSSVHSILLRSYDSFYAHATVNASSFQQRVRLNAARSCLCVVALSLAIVMAGTGELSVLSRLRLAHGQHERFGYGVHQALHMALGLLFLGRGMSTVGNSNTAVAAMVCAFFPNFNIQSDDNAAYPQAFRHLWALAVEPRCFVARDVESRAPVYLPIKVKTKENGAFGSHHLISPTLLPSLDRLVSVTIDSPRYWPLVLNLRQGKARRTTDPQHGLAGVLVKRRSGFLSYADDPKGNRTIFVKAGLTTGTADLGSMSVAPVAQEGLQSLRESVAAYTSDPFLLAFVRRLCAPQAGPSSPASPTPKLQKFCESVLLECLVNDQPHLIALYLHVRLVGQRPTDAPHLLPVTQMCNLQLATGFVAQSSGDPRQSAAILRQSFLRETHGVMTVSALDVARNARLRTHLGSYLQTGGEALEDLSSGDQTELTLYLASARVPPFNVLASLKVVVLEARAELNGLAAGQGGAAVLRLAVRASLSRLQTAGVSKGPAEEGDLGWVDVALEAWQ